MEANRRVDDDRLSVPLDPRLERPPELVRDERVDEEERVRRLVGDRADIGRPVGRVSWLLRRTPLRVPRGPAEQAGTKLRELGYRVSSGGFWTLCSVAYSSTSVLITSAPSP